MGIELKTPKLLPTPRKAMWGNGFLEWSKAEFEIGDDGLPRGAYLKISGNADVSAQGYKISISPDGIVIETSTDAGSRNALQTLRQIGMQADSRGFRLGEIEDAPDIAVRSFALDISAGKVPTDESLALLADRLALFKFNRLELIVGGSYSFEGAESAWADGSPMTPRRIARLKKICAVAGVELACCFSPFGHGGKAFAGLSCDDSFFGGLFSQIAMNFSADTFNIGAGLDVSEAIRAKNLITKSAATLSVFADSLSEDGVPDGLMPVFSPAIGTENFDKFCKKYAKYPCGFSTFADAKMSILPDFPSSKSEIDEAVSAAKSYCARGFTLTSFADIYCASPFCAIYAPIAYAGASAWGKTPSDEELADALDSFVFLDPAGDFARAVCALSEADTGGFVQKLFYADDSKSAGEISGQKTAVELDELAGAVDFAMGLASTSKPESRDARICGSELALAGAMFRFALGRADGNADPFEVETSKRFIAGEFERTWLARNGSGGLWTASSKIRGLRA